MGIFGNTSPFDPDVEKATSENNTSDEWGLIMEICDKGGATTANAKDCLRSILKRLAHQDPHVVVQAITLLDACVNNCGKTFHLEIASRDFETEYRRILTKAQPPVTQKLKAMLKRWAEGEFKTDPQLNLIPSLVSKLKSEGVDFSDTSDQGPKKTEAARSVVPAAAQKEEEDLARAIELSLQESKHTSPRNSTGGASSKTLYPSVHATPVPAAAAPPEAKKVRALYDFEAVEDNELTFLTGEIIHVVDSSDPNWWKGYNQRGEGLFPANFVTFDLTEPQPKPEPSQRKVQFAESVSVGEAGRALESEGAVEVNEGKIDRLLSLLHEANPEDASSDTVEMLQLENEVYRMGPSIDQALEKADRQHAQLTQLSADLVDALNLYHTLMREPPPTAGMMKPPFPQAAHYPPQMFNGTTTYQSVPSMHPYYSHIQQPNPGIMGAVSTSGMPLPMMGMPQQSMAMMMPPMGPGSLANLPPQIPPGTQPPGPAMGSVPPQYAAPQHQTTPTQHYQQSLMLAGGAGAGSLPPAVPPGSAQSYVM